MHGAKPGYSLSTFGVNSELRERETDAGFVEGLVDAPVHVEPNGPEIGIVHPCANDDVYAAGVKRIHGEERLGVVQDALVGADNLFYNFLHFADVSTLFHVENPLYTTSGVLIVVGDGATAQTPVGNIHQLVVGRGQDGMENLYLFYRA